MKITKSQLKQIIKEEGQEEQMVQVAEKLPQTEVGQEIMAAALQDPEIRAQAEQLAAQLKEQGIMNQLQESGEMEASGVASGLFLGPMAYMLAGMPGMTALQASIGPIAASAGIFGATMVGGMAIGLVASILLHIAKQI